MKTEFPGLCAGAKKNLMVAMLAGSSLAMFDASAAVMTFTDRASWEAAAGTWTETANFPGIAELDDVSSISLNGGTTLGLSSLAKKFRVGGFWNTWSGGYRGDVFWTNGATSVSATVTPGAGLGFEMEPVPFDDYLMNLILSDGSVISQTVTGFAGADFFGWVGTGVTSITISSTVDFAFGRFVEAEGTEIPEPATAALIGLGLLSATLGRRKSLKARKAGGTKGNREPIF